MLVSAMYYVLDEVDADLLTQPLKSVALKDLFLSNITPHLSAIKHAITCTSLEPRDNWLICFDEHLHTNGMKDFPRSSDETLQQQWTKQ